MIVERLNIFDKVLQLDLGPKTIENFRNTILSDGIENIFWNGPLGVFETPPFDEGSRTVAHAIVKATKRHHAISIVGGGETAAAVEGFGLAGKVSHVSTGGGASLRMLEGVSFRSVELLDGH